MSTPPPQPQPHSQPPPPQPYSPTSTTSEIQTASCDAEKSESFAQDSGALTPVVNPTNTVTYDDDKNDPESLQRRGTDSSIFSRFARAMTGLSSKSEQEEEIIHQQEDIDYHPDGYPKLAALLSSDENFLMCRKYGLLHTRVLLYRQDELRELEAQLLSLDYADAESNPRFLKSRVNDDRRDGSERKELIDKIDKKLKEYDDCVTRTRAMAALPPVTDRNYRSVHNHVQTHQPLCLHERTTFTERRQDFVALVDPREGSWFDAMIEDLLTVLPFPFARAVFSDPEQRRSTRDRTVFLYSKLRIDYFSRILIALLAVALLMAPVVVLFLHDESGGVKVAVILLFTLFFAGALSVFTKAKRHEVFAATAAYCAVLVVFLGNFN